MSEDQKTYRLMKKFQVRVDVWTSNDTFTIWADSAEMAKDAVAEMDRDDLFEAIDLEISFDATEAPKAKVNNGIVTPDGEWLDEDESYTDEDGVEIIPTDDPLLALSNSVKARLDAERHGVVPLPGFESLHDAMGIDPETGKKKSSIST